MPIKAFTLLDIKNSTEFCAFFWINSVLLDLFLSEDFINTVVKEIFLRKKTWWYRRVYKINNPQYKWLLRHICNELWKEFSFEEFVQWFIQGRSIFTNAKLHLWMNTIIHCDIKNFFESITNWLDLFESIWFNKEISEILTKLCFYKNYLPAGFPTSPILSNIYCRELDIEMYDFAIKNRYIYSRYGDDITFSNNLKQSIDKEAFSKIISNYWFTLNNKKFKIEKRWWNQYVTWLTVVDNKSPHIPRNLKRNIRLELYYIEKFGLEQHLTKTSDKKRIFSELCLSEMYWWIWYVCKTDKSLAKYISLKASLIEKNIQLTMQDSFHEAVRACTTSTDDSNFLFLR